MSEKIISQISISFENKKHEQEIARFIKSQKKDLGVSEYVKQLVLKDMKDKNVL